MTSESGPHLLDFPMIEEEEGHNGDEYGRGRCLPQNQVVFGLEHGYLPQTNIPIRNRSSVCRSYHKPFTDQVLHLEPIYTPKSRAGNVRHSSTFEKPLLSQNKSLKRTSQCPPSWIEATNNGPSLFEHERDELMQIHKAYSLDEHEETPSSPNIFTCASNTNSNLDLIVSSAREFAYPVRKGSHQSSEDDETAKIPPTLEQLFEKIRTFDEEDATHEVAVEDKVTSYDESSSLTNSDNDSIFLLPSELTDQTEMPRPKLERLFDQIQDFDKPTTQWAGDVHEQRPRDDSFTTKSSENDCLPASIYKCDFYGTDSGTPTLIACSFDTAESDSTDVPTQIWDKDSPPEGLQVMGYWQSKEKVDSGIVGKTPSVVRSSGIDHSLGQEDGSNSLQQGQVKKKAKGHKKLLKVVKKSLLLRHTTR